MSLDTLTQLLSKADLPAGLAWAVSAPVTDRRSLFPQEALAVQRAVPARKAEFAGGRQAARDALAKLGCPPMPILVGEGRAPIWPEGFCGSITHTDGMCLAFAGQSRLFRSIGIDLDLDKPLPADLIREVALSAELPVQTDLTLVARRIFSAKEALFKAQYPLTKAYIGFHAMAYDQPRAVARYTDHPETKAIPPHFKEMNWPVSQWCENGLILSLSTVGQQ